MIGGSPAPVIHPPRSGHHFSSGPRGCVMWEGNVGSDPGPTSSLLCNPEPVSQLL